MGLYGGPEVRQVAGIDLRRDGVEGLLRRDTGGNAQDPGPHQNGIAVQRLQGNPGHQRASEQHLTLRIITGHEVENRDRTPACRGRANLVRAATVRAVERAGVLTDVAPRDMAGLYLDEGLWDGPADGNAARR